MTTPIRRRTPPSPSTAAPVPTPTPPAVEASQTPPKPVARPLRRIVPVAKGEVRKTPASLAFISADAEERKASAETRQYAIIVKRYEDKVRNPRTAIRARCIQCCHGQMKEVQLCPAVSCALHPFRMGINPFNKRTAARLAGEQDSEDEGDDTDD